VEAAVTLAGRRYADGTRSGIALGLVLLASFFLAGRGIGASGAFASAAAPVAAVVAPTAMAQDPALADRIPEPYAPWNDWIVLQLLGVVIGASISARRAQRWRSASDDRSPGRVSRALAGGALMGLGARLAYGCTSGLAVSGGAMLATGAWLFIVLAFGTAILVTLVARDRSLGEA
jgi:uncharacterized membrane protein YedE/YeeE